MLHRELFVLRVIQLLPYLMMNLHIFTNTDVSTFTNYHYHLHYLLPPVPDQ